MIKTLYLPISRRVSEIERLQEKSDPKIAAAFNDECAEIEIELSDLLESGWRIVNTGQVKDANGEYLIFVLHILDKDLLKQQISLTAAGRALLDGVTTYA